MKGHMVASSTWTLLNKYSEITTESQTHAFHVALCKGMSVAVPADALGTVSDEDFWSDGFPGLTFMRVELWVSHS